jgi:hypothetical protein
MRLSLLGIYARIMRLLIIRICSVIKCDHYPLFAYEVRDALDLEIVIHASSK